MPAYKDMTRNTWYVKFRYTDWQGNRKETTKRGFPTKREAKEYEEEFKRKAQGTADMTLSSLYDIYIADKAQRTKQSTLNSVANTLQSHVIPYMGNLSLSDITPAVIRNWQNQLANTNSRRDKRPLKPSTLKNINGRFSTMLNFAVKYYGLPKNPMHITGSQGKYERRIDFWTKEEFDTFLSVVKAPMYQCIFRLLYYTGMRIGEALALTRDDFDQQANRITINKTFTQKRTTTAPKTYASTRHIIIPSHLANELTDVINRMSYESERIFPICYRSVNSQYNYCIRKSGVRKIEMHSLRHAHASQLIEMKVPITAIAQRLGHSSPQVTLSTYAHAMPQSDKDIADMLEDF